MNYEISSQGPAARVGLRDRVLALRAQPMFDGLDDDGLLLLAEHGSSASYVDGEVIAVEGAVARAVFLVLEGSRNMVEVRFASGELLWPVGGSSSYALHIDAGRVRCTSADGKHVAVGRGFTIGVLDVWTRTRVYEARTETPVIAFSISFEGFLSLTEAHPEVGLDLLRGFARDLTGGLHAGASMQAGRRV